MLEPKALLDFICDDVLPSYEIDPSVGRNDPELADAVRTYLAAARPAVTDAYRILGDQTVGVTAALSAHPCTTSPVVDHETANVDGKPNAVGDKFHPDILAAHAEFGGDLQDMQRQYDAGTANLLSIADSLDHDGRHAAAKAVRYAALGAAGKPAITDELRGAIAYQLTKRLVIDMPTARACVDDALKGFVHSIGASHDE